VATGIQNAAERETALGVFLGNEEASLKEALLKL
jgi:hypothetical protein